MLLPFAFLWPRWGLHVELCPSLHSPKALLPCGTQSTFCLELVSSAPDYCRRKLTGFLGDGAQNLVYWHQLQPTNHIPDFTHK